MKTKRWKKLYGHTISFVCPYCLKQFPLSEATKDHIVPASRGGKTDSKNLVLSCAKCNNEKGALTAEEYREWKRLNFIRNGGKTK
jgi:5-methylcytosine-specific restriction endonuclease McrA